MRKEKRLENHVLQSANRPAQLISWVARLSAALM
jgi:hypothetical protein